MCISVLLRLLLLRLFLEIGDCEVSVVGMSHFGELPQLYKFGFVEFAAEGEQGE